MKRLKRLIYKLRYSYFPTESQRVVRRWVEDGGDEALRFNYDLDEDDVVLDLGGYRGQWASDLFSRFRCRILVFEPVGRHVDHIRTRFRRNEKIEIYPFGLGGCSRRELIHLADDASSIFGESEEREEIDIVDVEQWLAEADWKISR